MKRTTLTEIQEVFQTQTNNMDVRQTPSKSLKLYATDGQVESVGAEFVRIVGNIVAKEHGYFIAGMREHLDEDRPCIEIWFDKIPESGGERVGTVTLDPHTEAGKELLNEIQETHSIDADTFHDDGNVTFIVREG